MAKSVSLYMIGRYERSWVKDFYDATADWWGLESWDPACDEARSGIINRLKGAGPLKILELGAGNGATAARLADEGHEVTAIELSPALAKGLFAKAAVERKGKITPIEGDYFEEDPGAGFDVVCYWDGFGVQEDAAHRALFGRAASWLKPDGLLLVDIFNSSWAARHAGEESSLDALEGIPTSVDMVRRYRFDAVRSRWIDEWNPKSGPRGALQQTARCYTPVDLALLVEGTGLAISAIELAEGRSVDFMGKDLPSAEDEKAFLDACSYLAVMKKV